LLGLSPYTHALCTPAHPRTRSHAQLQIWILAAKLEVRQKRLDAARKILGMALGMCPKDKTFKAYIELELQMGNIDRWGKSSPLPPHLRSLSSPPSTLTRSYSLQRPTALMHPHPPYPPSLQQVPHALRKVPGLEPSQLPRVDQVC
jgi:hypothetical protein